MSVPTHCTHRPAHAPPPQGKALLLEGGGTAESRVPGDSAGRMSVRTTGTGDGLLLRDGQLYEITWRRDKRTRKRLGICSSTFSLEVRRECSSPAFFRRSGSRQHMFP